jgi:hypothetical protein
VKTGSEAQASYAVVSQERKILKVYAYLKGQHGFNRQTTDGKIHADV